MASTACWTLNRVVWIALVVSLPLRAASPTEAYRTYLNSLLEKEEWNEALALIDENRLTNYGTQNSVLYDLDRGTVLHFAGSYAASDQHLGNAETRIEELYTRSLSKAAGTILINASTEDYAGEPHERALLYVMRALNFAEQRRIDDAIVEARKVTSFLTETGQRVGLSTYRADAFAQLLAALLFEDAGRTDDARIAKHDAEVAYALYQRDYGLVPPIFQMGPRDAGKGELVLIHYNGKAPLRTQVVTEVPVAGQTVRQMATSGDADTVSVALPDIAKQDSIVTSSLVQVSGNFARTVVVEPVGAIVTQSLADQIDAIRSRAVSRAISKEAAVAGAGALANRVGSGLGSFASAASRSAANAIEAADTRAWATLPTEVRMARMVLPPGIQRVDLVLLSADGSVVGTKSIAGVEISAGYRTYVQIRTAK